MIALETLEAADNRRWQQDLADVAVHMGQASRDLGVAFTSMADRFTEVNRIVHAWLRLAWPKPGYYVRDGKLRRDHRYFRDRAKLRRQYAKWIRQGRPGVGIIVIPELVQ